MDKKQLIKLIEKGYSTRNIAKEIKKSQTTVRYWLDKYDLKTDVNKKFVDGRRCKVCGKTIENKKICPGCYTKIRRYRNKQEAVRLKGGKCEECGWSGPLAGFSFHHLSDKKFEIGDVANKSWNTIKKELEKCQLLCLNCHSIKHSNVTDRFLKTVKNYKGKSF